CLQRSNWPHYSF
nr:immunoglobulin light chain junction region [Macaca mulatta]MOW74928.1 immunoglobulin light chain junction region [Macaca mulatta]